jgi:TAG lipase/lysophosphatidylethanolamine acyltransferase
MIGLYSSVDLLAKDSDGRIFVWSPSCNPSYLTYIAIKWGQSKGEREAPEKRLAELFNVNHFILSQSQPYIAPFLSRGRVGNVKQSILSRVFSFTGSEIRYRINQLTRLGLIPCFIASVFDQKIKGHVTISPPLSSMDFYTIFGNPTFQSLAYWVLKGEQSTWPFLSIIRNRTMIEKQLFKAKQEAYDILNARKISVEESSILKKRTQSIS